MTDFDNLSHVPEGLEQELLDELQNQTLDNLRVLRKHQRVDIRVPLRLGPASSSSHEPEITGTTVDLSGGGCLAVFPRPVMVGDVYRVHIDDPRLDAPMVFARCLRCRMMREDAFEAGFTFFTSITFGGETTEHDGDLLS